MKNFLSPSMKPEKRNPWLWVPSLYFAEGIPYIVVMTVSVIMYKRLGVSNTDIALYTSWLYLPWVIKPLWSPIVDLLKTKRFWIILMQFIIAIGLGGVALTIPLPTFFQYTLLFFWLLAFSSATHDIAADGFYMLGLNQHEQAFFVGIRSTFYRLAMITGQGLLVILAGYVESHTGLSPVEINVISKPNYVNQIVLPDTNLVLTETDQLIVKSSAEFLEVGTQPRLKAEVDSIVNIIKQWNLKNGFYSVEKSNSQTNVQHKEPSWWDKNIAKPLENFLRENFGEKKPVVKRSDYTGNIGIIYFYLTKKPDKEYLLHFGREKGDNSINLIEGSRFIFNESNWNKPAFAVIQLDPKLNYQTTAVFQVRSGDIPFAWKVTFLVLAGMFLIFFVYHFFILPYPKDDKPVIQDPSKNFFTEFFRTFVLFFKKRGIVAALGFLLFYRFAEAQLVKMASPFLLDIREAGGLALTTGQVGFVYGTVGIISLTLGGLLGGFVAAKKGLKYWLWWMVAAINLPDFVYVYLSQTLPDNFWIINACVAIEQFGYGFGFTAYMLFMIYISEGEHKTAHFAITTGIMALGMMIPGMFSGWLQEIIGYKNFFIWVCLATIPSFLVVKFVKVDPEFGKKKEKD
ncbi:MAG: MFS transporter [Ignavibacteria bacterium]|jgi:PAT family beta-lactamase induction signal transducer AmpG|nr:MFS transporter [Ignavibacteria bacterium]MDH7528632.1 MFS transporter [Ignavibacteria bacterium]